MALRGRPKFDYPPLELGQIRLIRLHDESQNLPFISCEIQNVNLDQCPHYTALSCTWGGQIPNRTITIGDGWLKITPNLYAFLLQVQTFKDEGRDIGWLWTDSLCINQGDNSEKSVQVGMMRQIYEKSQGIVVWLGEATYALERLFREIEKRQGDTRDISHWGDFGSPHAGNQRAANLEIPEDILQHPYWRRVWVLQEVTTPGTPMGVKVWYGHVSCPFPILLSLVLEAIPLEVLGRSRAIAEVSKRKPARAPFDALKLLQNKRQEGIVSISDLFALKGHCDASDPKDKILAPLQLTVDAITHVADYNNSVDDIYRNFARHIVETYRNLDILEYAITEDESTTEMRSWVPDWRTQHKAKFQKDFGSHEVFDSSFRMTTPNTRLQLRHDYFLQQDGNTLHVGAILLAVIEPEYKYLFWFPRYFKRAPEESSLWAAASDVSSLHLWPAFVSPESLPYLHLNRSPEYPRVLQAGEVLCLLPGSRWPVFLRPAGRAGSLTFKFICLAKIPKFPNADIFANQLFEVVIQDLLCEGDTSHCIITLCKSRNTAFFPGPRTPLGER